MKKFSFVLVGVLGVIFLLNSSSCRKESFDTDPNSKLIFSTDTVLFDTVFTALGDGNPRSVNKRFTVRNPHNKSIKTSLKLAGGEASPFRINVDGIPSDNLNEYEIRPNDSIYVFVEASLDQGNQNNPFIIQDSIVFTTNGNVQDVKLVAWGQDAYYFADSILTGQIVWNDQVKPYVIFNSILVDENSKLTIAEGVKVYSSVNSYLFVNGTLEIQGTKDNPVILQGARLEQAYANTPSQWFGIRMLTASRQNIIRHATIKNGVIGVQVDSLQVGGGYKLDISHTSILNMSAAGLLGYTAWIKATNVLAANCGQFTFLGELGGKYDLTHCTFANYNTTFLRSKPAFGLSNANYQDGAGNSTNNNLEFNIRNCIVWGSLREELLFFNGGGGSFSGNISSTILRTELPGFGVNNNLVNIDPRFLDFRDLKFELDTLSPAKDAGAVLIPPVLDDLKGELRDANPDLGAFERKE